MKGFSFACDMGKKALTARKDGTFRGFMKQKTAFGRYLEENGYSTHAFADKVGISQPTIWRLSTGTFKLYNPDVVDLINIVCGTSFVEKDFRC